MKKLYKNIVLFLSPVFLALFFLKANQRLMYAGLKDDCLGHASWIYDRLYHNNKPIDVVISGSSQTINGIDDKLISDSINLFVTNMGYCRLGRNLNYTLIHQTINIKKPRLLVLEVLVDEDRYSHPVFPYIASTKEVFTSYPFFNKDFLPDIFTHISYKLELTQDVVYKKEINPPIDTNDFGFTTPPDTASPELLLKFKNERSNPKPQLNELEKWFYEKFPLAYLEKINSCCKENNVKLVFLFLPRYGEKNTKPNLYKTYSQYGSVIIPPNTIINSPYNWHDENHMNQTGARELSIWLSGELRKHY